VESDVRPEARRARLPGRTLEALLHLGAGVGLTLSSTFVGQRSAYARYPDIMGCEEGCTVAATGWPLVFVRDYLGMSVINSADILEVWFAADRFDRGPFVLNAAVWTMVSWAASSVLLRAARGVRRRGDR